MPEGMLGGVEMRTGIIGAVAWVCAAGFSFAQPGAGQRIVSIAEATNLIGLAFDANNDHRISRAEWHRQLGGQLLPQAFDANDANHDGFLDAAEARAAIQAVVATATNDCDTNIDNVFSGDDELGCLADYLEPPTEQDGISSSPSAPATPAPPHVANSPPAAAPSANAASSVLTINASLRAPGPGRNFTPIANVPVYLSSTSLEQTLRSVGLTQPTPIRAWLRACQNHEAACRTGMGAIRANPAARGLTDAQGHLTLSPAPAGHYFVVAIASIDPGHVLIWNAPIDLQPGADELTLGDYNSIFIPPG